MNDPITLTSGAQLTLGIASFQEANDLKKALARELVAVNVNLTTLDIAKLSADEMNSFKNVFFQILGSDAIESALWKCMARSLYNQTRISAETFQPEAAREDYHQVAWEVMVYSLRPFGKSLLSLFAQNLPKLSNVQK